MSIPESVLREIERAIQAAEFPRGMSVHDGKAKVDSSHLRRLLAELAALRADAERLEWYFGPASKADWLDTFMTGVRENWTVDQWRAAIDAAMERADET